MKTKEDHFGGRRGLFSLCIIYYQTTRVTWLETHFDHYHMHISLVECTKMNVGSRLLIQSKSTTLSGLIQGEIDLYRQGIALLDEILVYL